MYIFVLKIFAVYIMNLHIVNNFSTDTLGTGPMFFEFYRIWNILKQTNEPFYWMFENVCHMEVVNRDTISK